MKVRYRETALADLAEISRYLEKRSQLGARKLALYHSQRIQRRHGRACPGHPRLASISKKDVDARHKAGHDG
jgi:hypothetical protein